jgi:hypothetical protein
MNLNRKNGEYVQKWGRTSNHVVVKKYLMLPFYQIKIVFKKMKMVVVFNDETS